MIRRAGRVHIGNWWRLKSGAVIQVCGLWTCTDTQRPMATVRYVSAAGVVAHGAFDLTVKFLTTTAEKVAP